MKKLIYRLLPILLILAVVASVLIFYGFTLKRDDGLNITETDLIKTADINGNFGCAAAFDGNAMTSWAVSKNGSEAIVDFKKSTDINALLLNEVGFNVTRFSVYYWSNEDWSLCYRQNEIGVNRLATFYTINTVKLKIVFDELKNTALISSISAYNLAPRERTEALRVTSYITPPSVKAGLVDPDSFDVITDVQFIAYGRFCEDGSIGEKADEELQMLKNLIGGRDVNIFLTIFPPLAPYDIADVFRNHLDASVLSVTQSVLNCGADGADFDWEYPKNTEEYALYSNFLVQLKTELVKHDKQLSVALSPWGIQLSDEAIQAIDQLQIMSYDLFDHKGDNNSYTGSVDNSIKYMINKGFCPEQLNLGISYYGRPSDGSGKWYNYNDPQFTPEEYIMYQKNVWFNSVTTVRDKTVYAILKGLGGIMTFAQDEDLPLVDPLSLTASIGKAKTAFSKGV